MQIEYKLQEFLILCFFIFKCEFQIFPSSTACFLSCNAQLPEVTAENPAYAFGLADHDHTSGITMTHLTFQQACSQGGASGCKAPSTNVDTSTRNLLFFELNTAQLCFLD
jgi:hypothetical protein